MSSASEESPLTAVVMSLAFPVFVLAGGTSFFPTLTQIRFLMVGAASFSSSKRVWLFPGFASPAQSQFTSVLRIRPGRTCGARAEILSPISCAWSYTV